LIRIVGVDSVSGAPRTLDVDTFSEREAWKHAELEGISPREAVPISNATAEPPCRKGVIYLISCGSYYKIGKSTTPNVRYAQLKIQLPQKPEIIHEIHTNNIDYAERHWHKRFHSKRANGEWFALDREDVAEFSQCERIVVSDIKRSDTPKPGRQESRNSRDLSGCD
jgi:hypothetical protein